LFSNDPVVPNIGYLEAKHWQNPQYNKTKQFPNKGSSNQETIHWICCFKTVVVPKIRKIDVTHLENNIKKRKKN
jgi:hypothetical protein